jgi:hypothetical protein
LRATRVPFLRCDQIVANRPKSFSASPFIISSLPRPRSSARLQ